MQTRPTCSAPAVDPSLPFETFEEILFYNLGSAQVIMRWVDQNTNMGTPKYDWTH